MELTIDDKTFESFIDYDLIEKRIRVLAIQINVDYENKVPIIIGVLNGSFMFMADLMKQIEISCEADFIKVSSYRDMQSTGEVKEELGLSIDIENRDIILIEDIVDTGNTLEYLINKLKTKSPASIKVASLLLKPDALQKKIDEIAYIGFEITNDFVVGYGLDYNGIGRNTKNIYRIKV
ncbi:hypoxanthine phosphoribosyltransferase [Pseudopedobacter saltans DSM 12145]|uniref:Hypoxanthine phosphoribosyltransferase n=1 Tax=Pseudopedobacter saltans (strain ATCC 51119 / DSM 12145 / JCM 21818 / CCUG 39354 / LMG 10337 / NBRC 100064 / NCIMB 13643) TaxID=762903 RepID=F0S9K1_PSESL|nr:hypoxanthine phosphoribosyltransferase [Pseudopedobacter saltans]ADY53554.1 hypoxanthine phosphoribosyltransferase [Pseudopedobacter saltans DSM 12145]